MNAIEAARLLRDAAGLIGSYGEYYTTGSTNPVSVHEEHINLLRRLADRLETMEKIAAVAYDHTKIYVANEVAYAGHYLSVLLDNDPAIGGDAHIESLYPGAFIFAERMAEEAERKREAIGILREEMESM